MADFQPDTKKMRTYAIGGAVVVAVVIFVIVVAFGGPWYYALPAGLFMGLFTGGGLGFLAGARVAQVSADADADG